MQEEEIRSLRGYGECITIDLEEIKVLVFGKISARECVSQNGDSREETFGVERPSYHK